jgi:hypothetical protein
MSSSLAEVASAGRKLLPIFAWIPAYRRKWLLRDVLGGVALWAVSPRGWPTPVSSVTNILRHWLPSGCCVATTKLYPGRNNSSVIGSRE